MVLLLQLQYHRAYRHACFQPQRRKIVCIQFSFVFDHSGWNGRTENGVRFAYLSVSGDRKH